MKTKIVFSEKCLGYGSWHIESPERVKNASDILEARGYEFLAPEPASEDALLRVHDNDYLWAIRKGFEEDGDTPAYDNIFEYARLSAGGALLAAKTEGFSLMRPPGHHCGTHGRALGAATRGFCYLNNIAIAVRHLDKPTLILDIDGHHGNGTQEIFFGTENVTYLSLHRHPNYPGTGTTSKSNCRNYLLPPDCGDEAYIRVLDKALSGIEASKLEAVAVSAGFDTHAGDLASLGLTGRGYREVGIKIAALNRPTFFVLEGGYDGMHVGKDIDEMLTGFES